MMHFLRERKRSDVIVAHLTKHFLINNNLKRWKDLKIKMLLNLLQNIPQFSTIIFIHLENTNQFFRLPILSNCEPDWMKTIKIANKVWPFCTEILTLIVKSVCDFMSNHCPDSSVVNKFWKRPVKEWGLKNGSRKL